VARQAGIADLVLPASSSARDLSAEELRAASAAAGRQFVEEVGREGGADDEEAA